MPSLPVQTLHARQRAAQRRVPEESLRLLFEYGDIELPQKRGCRSLQLSRQMVANLLADGRRIEIVECASRTVLILDPADKVVTAIKSSEARRRSHGTSRRMRR